jgi:hypothetical protein
MKDVNSIIRKNDKEYIEIFNLLALSEQARQNAIKKYRDRYLNYPNEIRKHLQTHFAEILEEAGFPEDDINLSLGYQQDDGAAFYGGIELESLFKKYPDLLKHIPSCQKLLSIYNEVFPKDMCSELDFKDLFDASVIKTNNFYHNSGSMAVSVNLYSGDIENLIEEINEKIYGSLYPDNEVNMTEWEITRVEDNDWTIENTSCVWSVIIDEKGMAQYEANGVGIPDAVKKTFNEKSNSKSEPRDYPEVYLSASMIEKEMNALEIAIKFIIDDTSSQLEKEGYEIYEAMINDETMIGRIRNEEIRFDIAGNFIFTEIPEESTDTSLDDVDIATIHETMTSGELELFVKQVQSYGKCAFFENYVEWLCDNGYSASEQMDLLQRAITNYFMFEDKI